MKQPDRPAPIVTILKTITSEYPADMMAPLEAYITALEANQLVILANDNFAASQAQANPPIWSHMRVIARENHRRERALRKQNHYR